MPQKKSRKNKRTQGSLGERYAATLLANNGYKILETNFRSRSGEIDLIAQDKDTRVFVEVKARWSKKFGKPEEAVDQRKLFRIKRVIDYYNMTNKNVPKKIRIDVVAIEIENGKVISSKIIKAV